MQALSDGIGWLASRTATPCLIDRESGQQIKEVMPLLGALREWVLYRTWPGNWLLKLPATWWVLGWQHRRIAAHANSPASKADIPQFIKTYQIDASAAEKPVEAYGTLQEFFARRLKPGLRPIAAPTDGSVAVCPADSRVVVYDSIDAATSLWIKGVHFNIHRLMGPGYEAQDHWRHAAVAINRLAPMDHHRLHAAVPGRVVRVRRHGHKYMGSEHAAIHSRLDILTENDRIVMELDSEAFGTVVQVMIGASEVGSVLPLVKEGQEVAKGDEVAEFAFGGSIMLTLFHRDSGMVWAEDLAANSSRGAETLVTYGSLMGRTSRGRGGGAAQHEHSPAGP